MSLSNVNDWNKKVICCFIITDNKTLIGLFIHTVTFTSAMQKLKKKHLSNIIHSCTLTWSFKSLHIEQWEQLWCILIISPMMILYNQSNPPTHRNLTPQTSIKKSKPCVEEFARKHGHLKKGYKTNDGKYMWKTNMFLWM